jgi:hypothetical protein
MIIIISEIINIIYSSLSYLSSRDSIYIDIAALSAWKQLIAINNIANKIQYILFLFIVPSIIFIVFIYLFFH